MVPFARLATFLTVLLVAQPTSADTNTLTLGDAPPGQARVQALAWLTGYWQGKGLGGQVEEFWGDPIGDRMLGLFTLRNNDELAFSEHMSIVEEAGSLTLKVKHFDANFVGWETKADYVRFPLVKLGDNEAWFDGLTLRREDRSLTIYLVIAQDDERRETVFRYQLVR